MIVGIIRGATALVAVAMWALYLRAGLSADGTPSAAAWTNPWMGRAITATSVFGVVFVLTAKRAGTRGSVVSNLTDMLRRTRISDPVDGTARVVSASAPPRSGQNAGRAMCAMNLVVTVPGQPAVAVESAAFAPLAKWPFPGTALPIVADRRDPRRFTIVWEKVLSGWQAGVQQAQQMADHLNTQAAEPSARAASSSTGVRGVSVTINGEPAGAQDLAPFEAMTGMDLNADGIVGPASTVGDPVAQLERLASLRSAGALTEDEYERAKEQILGR